MVCAGDWAPYEHMLEELQARADKDARKDAPAALAKHPAEPKDKKRRCRSLPCPKVLKRLLSNYSPHCSILIGLAPVCHIGAHACCC